MRGQNKNALFSGLFFFMVLFSLFVMRPFRSAVAAQIGTADLTFFLFLVVLVMLFVNFIYSAVVSRIKESRLVLYIYGFFILNLVVFAYLNFYYESNYALGATFYVWYNIFNFFVVSIFWAKIVNCFDRTEGNKFFGVISAFGSAGAFVGSRTVASYLTDAPVTAISISLVALMLAIFFSSKLKPTNTAKIKKKDISIDLVDQINQVKNNPLVQKLLAYAFIWTCCSTALYFFSLEIINKYTNDIVEQRAIFAEADSLVTPITFFSQILITRFLLESRFFGLKFVLGIYGVLFMIAYLMMAGHFADFLFTGTGVLLFLIISALMRPFEYAINKPARETVYTTLKKSEKYRSTVFIDTFINRFGDASGGLLFNILLTLGLTLAVAPLAILPLTLVLSGFGVNISKSVKDVKS